jgi:ELWxxDGT repeat protein
MTNPNPASIVQTGLFTDNNSDPSNLTNVNGTLYFTAYDGTNGNELWKIDSTGNAVLVNDINTGSNSSNPSNLTNVNGTLYFSASDGTNGNELWKIDSTGNAVLLKYDYTVSNVSNPSNLTNVNGTLYFSAQQFQNQLWKIDSNGNAVPVKDLNAFFTSNLTNVNGTLYFSAFDATNGYELWKIDSTDNAVLVKDINTGSGGSYPYNLTNVNGTLYFTAYDDTHGYELWKIDSTGNAVLVKDIYTGNTNSGSSNLTNVNGTLYFTASDDTHGYGLWKIDSTGNAVLVKDNTGGNFYTPNNLTDVNGTLYFSIRESSIYDGIYGYENKLWTIDSIGNAVLVKDIKTGPDSSFFLSISNFTNVNGTLYFSAYDPINGYELWQSDGTSAGTQVIDLAAGSLSSFPFDLINVDGKLFFSAFDTNSGTRALWQIGGNINQPPTDITLSANSIAENIDTTTRILVGDLTITDPDATENNNILTLSGTDADKFEIEAGKLYLKAGEVVDYETKSSYDLTLTATDGTLVYSKFLPVRVTNINEVVTNITLSDSAIFENIDTTTRILVGDLTITDPDATDNDNVLALSGTDADKFEIDAGKLYLKAGEVVDYETKSSYDLTLTATDGSLVYSNLLTMGVTNVN